LPTKWFAKAIWHLDLQIGLANGFGIQIWQTMLPDLDLPKQFGKPFFRT
jgi:hypothetical protein